MTGCSSVHLKRREGTVRSEGQGGGFTIHTVAKQS